MNLERINEILNKKQIRDIYYNNRPVWVQEINNDVAKVGFVDNNEEKDVLIKDLYDKEFI